MKYKQKKILGSGDAKNLVKNLNIDIINNDMETVEKRINDYINKHGKSDSMGGWTWISISLFSPNGPDNIQIADTLIEQYTRHLEQRGFAEASSKVKANYHKDIRPLLVKTYETSREGIK